MSIKIVTENKDNIIEFLEFKRDENISCFNLKDSLNELKETGTVVILGNFDGVHKAHRKIFQKGVENARKNGYKTVVYTFNEYPDKRHTRITNQSEKAFIMNNEGIDYLYFEEFEKVRNFSPENFVKKILIEKLNAKKVLCGFNFTFGKGKSGNPEILKELLKKNGIELEVQEAVFDNNSEVISSTNIRKYIKETNLEKVKELLGHNLLILGKVVHGKQLGRTIGFPTANLKFENRVYPSFGVYGVKIYFYENGIFKTYAGVMNIGRNPTVDKDNLSVETHIFDFDKDIYGKYILIEIFENIRKEVKFGSIDELKNQIDKDSKYWKNEVKKIKE